MDEWVDWVGRIGPMAYEHLLGKRDGDLFTITLNRPEKRNALAIGVMRELIAAFTEAGASDARGVMLAANGPVFSAGHNFADMKGASLVQARELFEVCTELMDTIQGIPQPVLAKVHALATAAGCQLVATCDLAVAAEDAKFAIPGGKGGLFCHTPLVAVARNIGRKRALEMAMTGDPIDARTAADWGLVNRVVPADQLDDAAWDLLSRAGRGSAESKGLGKQGFYAQIGLDQPNAYRYAVGMMAAAAVTPDAQEGISAFLEKRYPQFGS
jgi:enoyl-CoA hydratase/carnithine racemase